MASNPDLPPQLAMSLGGEGVPFTVQAEGSRMSQGEAAASGLLDLPDEPGTVRFPISVNVMIPGHLLQPPAPAAGTEANQTPAGAAEQAPPRRRRTDPAAAEKIAAGLRDATAPDAAAEAARFRDMLRATRAGRDRAPGSDG